MQRLVFFLKENWIGILISILIGFVVVAPPIVWRMSTYYEGVPMLKTNTEALYLSQVQEVYDGHGGLGNSYLADLKDEPYLFPPASAHIIAGFGRIFGLNAVDAALAIRFLVPTIISFLIYLFGFYITKKKIVGIVAAPFIILGYSLMDPHSIIDLFNQNNWSQEKMFIDYGRPLTPQISVLFFYAYLLIFWRYIQEKSNKVYGLLSILVLGFSFYVYFYTWTYLFTFNAFLFFLYLFRKNWSAVKKILFVSLLAFLIGLPYLIHSFSLMTNPLYAEIGPRFGFVHARSLYISKTVLGALVVFILSYKILPKKFKEFFTAIFLTAFFTVNQHLITGKYFRFDNHHHWYYTKPMIMLLFTAVIFILFEKLKINKFFVWAVGLLMVLVFFYDGILVQKVSYDYVSPSVKEEQRYSELFNWLNNSTEKDSTILSSFEISEFTTALTHDNVYYHGGALYTLVPNERFLYDYLAYMYLEGISKEDAHNYLEEHREDISYFAFGYTYLVQKDLCVGCFPDEIIDQMEEEYRQINDDNFISFLKRYPIDYIVWDKKTNPEWDIDKFGLEEVAVFGDINVYAL